MKAGTQRKTLPALPRTTCSAFWLNGWERLLHSLPAKEIKGAKINSHPVFNRYCVALHRHRADIKKSQQNAQVEATPPATPKTKMETRSEIPEKQTASLGSPLMPCSAADLAKGLRHAANDHPCCKVTLTMAADAIIRMAQALNNLAAPLGRTDYTVAKLDGIVRKIAADALIFQQNAEQIRPVGMNQPTDSDQ